MRIEKFLAALQTERTRRAVEYLSTPVRGDAFEYGQRSGIIQGLQIAEVILERLMEEEDQGGQVKR